MVVVDETIAWRVGSIAGDSDGSTAAVAAVAVVGYRLDSVTQVEVWLQRVLYRNQSKCEGTTETSALYKESLHFWSYASSLVPVLLAPTPPKRALPHHHYHHYHSKMPLQPAADDDDAVAVPMPLCAQSSETPAVGLQQPFTEDQTRKIAAQLMVGVPLSETGSRPGPNGQSVHYMEGWRVILEANKIFGFDGWSTQIVHTDVRDVTEMSEQQQQQRYSATVSVQIRVTVRGGVTREDRGSGTSQNMYTKGEAITKAEKDAVTDATKRALKNFGNALGLSLYNRQYTNNDRGSFPRYHAGDKRTYPYNNNSIDNNNSSSKFGPGAYSQYR